MSGYIGPLPVPQGIQRKQSFTATASQTTFNTNGYTDGDFINVYLNGVRLINGTDYTATNGSDIVLTTGASASDVLDFETFQTFQLVDQQFENVTLKNPTHEDTDGGRESAVSFKGEQSGGEISTLAQIQASHDGTSDDQKGDLIFKTNDGSDNDAPTEAMRIDSSQNVLVGKTSSNATDVGIVANANGRLYATVSGASSIFNRTTSDGDIIDLRKDGTTVGSIASASGVTVDIDGGSTYTGIRFDSSSITPRDAGSVVDNTVDLGKSTARFNDLYLGGGAYIGGTGASNKLDDYEEGSFTPDFENESGVSLTSSASASGSYVKIGKSVQVAMYISGGTLSGTSGEVRVVNLPFTAQGSIYTAFAVWPFGGFTGLSSGEQIIARNSVNTTYLVIQKISGGTGAQITNTDFGGTLNFSAQISYETT